MLKQLLRRNCFWYDVVTFGALLLGGQHMRIVWVTLIIILFGVAMFWLRRYMER